VKQKGSEGRAPAPHLYGTLPPTFVNLSLLTKMSYSLQQYCLLFAVTCSKTQHMKRAEDIPTAFQIFLTTVLTQLIVLSSLIPSLCVKCTCTVL